MTVSNQIIEVLNYLCDKFGIALDWSKESVIPYLQELCEKYISWEIATSTAWIAISVILFLAPSIALIVFDIKTDASGGALVGVGVCGVVAAFVVICIQLFDILGAVYFPEMQLIKYINHLIELS